MLAARGWTVYATARRPESIADLEQSGCRILPLDVTDQASAAAAVDEVVRREGAVGVLVNNAGANEIGATETVSIERVRAMFETNMFGMLRMCQLALPTMRARRWGRVINIGSMNGRFIFPAMGAYAATKHAMEAFSDAMRYELRPYGVGVSLVAPGMVTTRFGHDAAEHRDTTPVDVGLDRFNREIADVTLHWDSGPRRMLACTPRDVADRVVRAAEARHPRARYRVAPSAAVMLSLRRILPESAFAAVLRTQFPSPKPPR